MKLNMVRWLSVVDCVGHLAEMTSSNGSECPSVRPFVWQKLAETIKPLLYSLKETFLSNPSLRSLSRSFSLKCQNGSLFKDNLFLQFRRNWFAISIFLIDWGCPTTSLILDFFSGQCHRNYEKSKIHPCGSDVISEHEHRSLCGRNETRTVNLQAIRKIRQSPEQANRNPVGDTAGSVRRATGMEKFHNHSALITWSFSLNSLNNRPSEI